MVRVPRAAVAALLLCVAAAGCDSVEDRVAAHAERGAAFVAEGDDDRARLEFSNALKLNENHAPSRRALAGVYERDGELPAARANYALAAELDPADAQSRWRLARVDLLMGRVEPAAGAAEEAVALAPANADALATLAAARLRQQRAAEAVTLADQALAIDPEHIEARVAAAASRLAQADADAALAEADAGLAVEPDNLALSLLRLNALRMIDNAEAIGAQLASMAELFPDQPGFGAALARWRMDAGDEAGAERALRERAARSADPELTLDVVRYLNDRRGADAAIDELRGLLGAPGDAPYAFALAELQRLDGDVDGATKTLRAFIDRADTPETAADGRVRLARLSLAQGDADAASALLETVLARDPERVDALGLRAAIRIDAYQLEPAIEDLRRAQSLAPENATLLLLEARAHERGGEAALARDRLAAATRISNHEPQIALLYARALVAENQTEAALSVLVETTRRRPDSRQALAQLAALRLEGRDWAGARDTAQQLRALEEPEAASAADRIDAVALAGLGRSEESAALLERAATRAPNDADALAALVTARLQAGDAAGAVDLVDTRLRAAPDDPRALLLRAELHLRDGDAGAAAETLERLITVAPDDPAGPLALVRLRLAQGAPDQAEAVARDGLARDGDRASLRLLLAQILEGRGAVDDAIAQYEILYATAPDTPIVANNLASLLAEHRGDDPETLARAETIAMRLRDSDVPHFRDTVGWIRFLGGDAEGALPDLEAAAEALPDNALVQYHAGRALAALGREAAARERLRLALAIDGDFAKAANARAALSALPATP